MSLATTGGGGLGGAGGGAGGLTLAHDASGGAMANLPNAPPPPMEGMNATGTSSSSAPSTVAIEICDKTQKVTLSSVKETAHLPIAALDLHAAMPTVALYPPLKKKDSSQQQQTEEAPVFLGKMKAKLGFQATETSHKTLRKYLLQTKPYSALKTDALVTKLPDETKSGDKSASSANPASSADPVVIILDRPHLWLGVRRVEQAVPSFVASQFPIDVESSTSAIAEEGDSSSASCWWTNSTLDGSTLQPTRVNAELDRVVAKIRLHSSKKALTILPEEATQLLLHQARSHVATKFPDLPKDELIDYPLSIAVPHYALHDAAMEALYEAANAETTPTVLFGRSICAVVGAFLKPSPAGGPNSKNLLVQRMATVQQALLKQHKLRHAGNPREAFVAAVTIVAVGTTPEGIEVTAIQCAHPCNSLNQVFFEEFSVLANVSRFVENSMDAPAALLPACLDELQAVLELVAPDADGPAAVLTYGTTTESEALTTQLNAHKKKANPWLSKVPVIAASPESVPTGAALLGGLALGRIVTDTKSKTLPVRVQNVATVATGLAFYYTQPQVASAGKQLLTTPPDPSTIKTVFDFDRRLPAGPYSLEFKASECVVYRQRLLNPAAAAANNNASKFPQHDEDDEAFVKAVKDAEARKRIPDRETAALEFAIQVFQKYTRNGDWHAVGDPMYPLVKYDTPIDEETDEDKDEVKIACEQVTLELSMTVTGTLSSALMGERESVVQAVKSARGRLVEYYGWLAFAVLFFGGFFVKSYWEDYVWKRDTQRLLDYYRHVIPGSPQDGDPDTARWLSYKYRHNKQKLWDNLEQKYGVAVPDAWPEDDDNDDGKSGESSAESEEVNLDAGNNDDNNEDDDDDKAGRKDEDGGEANEEKDEQEQPQQQQQQHDRQRLQGDDESAKGPKEEKSDGNEEQQEAPDL